MSKKISVYLALVMYCFSLSLAFGEDADVIAIKGAKIIPVVSEDIQEGTILIKDGTIADIGENISIPVGARTIEAKGMVAYPGMIDSYCYLGLQEISSVRATVDYRETGRFNPQVKAVEALWPDSMHIPIARSNGITVAVVVCTGGLISGQSGLIRLVGYTPEEMVIKSSVAMYIQFPSTPRPRRGATPPPDQTSKQIQELKDVLKSARYYHKRKDAAKKNMNIPLPEFDEKLEYLLPVINRELPAMISVNAENDIKAAIKFVKEENLKAIFFGVTEGWKVADELKESGIPVIFGSMNVLPSKWEDGYDAVYRNPGILAKKGVQFAFSSQSSSMAKDLPYHAGKAAAFGLDRKEALKGVTIYPAQIFGVADKMGSLEKGKLANVVLADGDILDVRTNIKYVFIEGKQTDLSNVYTELLERYKKRH